MVYSKGTAPNKTCDELIGTYHFPFFMKKVIDVFILYIEKYGQGR